MSVRKIGDEGIDGLIEGRYIEVALRLEEQAVNAVDLAGSLQPLNFQIRDGYDIATMAFIGAPESRSRPAVQ